MAKKTQVLKPDMVLKNYRRGFFRQIMEMGYVVNTVWQKLYLEIDVNA